MPAVIFQNVGATSKLHKGIERIQICGEWTYSTMLMELMSPNCETLVLYYILLAIRRTNASLALCGLCTRQRKHDCSEMAEAVTWVSDYCSIFPHPSLKVADFIAYS